MKRGQAIKKIAKKRYVYCNVKILCSPKALFPKINVMMNKANEIAIITFFLTINGLLMEINAQ